MFIDTKEVLPHIIEFSQDLFTPDVIASMDSFREGKEETYFEENFEQSKEAVYSAIEELLKCPDPFSANGYFRQLRSDIQHYIMLRVCYLEKEMTENEVYNVPEQVLSPGQDYIQVSHHLFFRWGLVDLWNERFAYHPRYRNN